MLLLSVYYISIALPAHPILGILFAVLGIWVLVRLAARFIEILPG